MKFIKCVLLVTSWSISIQPKNFNCFYCINKLFSIQQFLNTAICMIFINIRKFIRTFKCYLRYLHRNQRLKTEIVTAIIANTNAIVDRLLCFFTCDSSIIFNDFDKPGRSYENHKLASCLLEYMEKNLLHRLISFYFCIKSANQEEAMKTLFDSVTKQTNRIKKPPLAHFISF